jgi:hypothetical protein
MNWQTALNALGGTLLVAMFLFLCAVFLWSIVAITRIVLAHRQRMALIARGMHPDRPGVADRGVGPAEAALGPEVAGNHA